METKIFLNLSVKDLNRSIAFFTELGFSFNQKFTNDKGTCLIIGENINVMLLVEEFYLTFTDKQICDTATTSEVLISISVQTRQQVDRMIEKAVNAGGTHYREAKDYGWMYQRTFLDLDGHHWEIFFMDESQIPDKM
ncbi:glyoxalase/bleomycin resistance/extradiol dioxygenase family protein [Flavobacterium sp. ANB]|uniref:VOC family protein n=1 Tax=unclassified Flavobacterium TaxID=196869 RepID=UPI0012BA0D2E|nr:MULTISPECIES: VOC family protein [unclassified Flavobacterium]MBF4518529.1 glyoxalase/bleomycin resistance/extradiol dioxygenase family protein [Flavobacterium sp. ANB]MTD67965.1 glyoxalase/bleomycin resistance/extradiol dioxygenase family protein [Flavobacterium sp. LC2016-13]